jgi:CheY-like chemotaxis protein
MPVMDGIRATKAIRALPRGNQVPILAMTANAFEEDRQQCLAAGMNDHVSKPVDPEALFSALLKWLPKKMAHTTAHPSELAPLTTPTATLASVPVAPVDIHTALHAIEGFDYQQGLKGVRGKLSLYLQLLSKYAAMHRDDVALILGHLQAQQHSEALRLAHSLKGMAATLGATQLQGLAAQLESGIKNQLSNSEISALAAEVNRVQQTLIEAITALPTVESVANNPAPPSQPAAAPAEIDWMLLRSGLNQIEALLVEDNIQVNQLIRRHVILFQRAFGHAATELERLIQACEYQSALELIASLRKTYRQLTQLI